MRPEILSKLQEKNPAYVDLRKMNIHDNEIKEIVDKIIELKPNVELVYFTSNQISDASAETIMHAFANLAQLKFLDLQDNILDESGIKKIYSLIEAHPDLKFAFSGNKMIDSYKMMLIEESYQVKLNR